MNGFQPVVQVALRSFYASIPDHEVRNVWFRKNWWVADRYPGLPKSRY